MSRSTPMKTIERLFLTESFDLACVSHNDIEKYCRAELPHACDVYSRWIDYQEELHILHMEALQEFGL